MGRKLVFLLPGRQYTDGFLNSMLATFHHYVTQTSDEVYTAQYPGSDVYSVRNRILYDQYPGPRPKRWSDYQPCNGMPYDYLIWIDSDQVWGVEQVERLLSHEVDVVAAVTPIDNNPFSTRCAAGYWNLDDGAHPVTNLDMTGFQRWREMAAERDPALVRGDLLRVDWAGFGFMVVKRGVFEALTYPWFRHTVIQDERFQVECSEDTGWCRRVGDAGFDIHVDPAVIVGHQKTILLDEKSVKQACYMKWKAGVRVVPKGSGASTELEAVNA